MIDRFKTFSQNKNTKRTLYESVIVSEIIDALKDWKKETNRSGVLIGGLALSFYTKPRYTSDIDLIFLSDKDIPTQVNGFKKIRGHSFQHNKTHVEIEVLSPAFLGISNELVKTVIDNSSDVGGIIIADIGGIVALKIQRGSFQDLADIEAIKNSGHSLKKIMQPYERFLTSQQLSTIYSI
jgi:hypothetical protein